MLDKTAAPEAFERTDGDEGQEVENFDLPVEGRRGLLHRFAPQRLVSRIVLLNLLGLVILVTDILYFNQFRQGLIDARVQSLTTQAQIIAAAIAGSATADTGSIVINPDSLDDNSDPFAPDADQLDSLDFPINPETTGPVLRRLLANSTIRGRIIDPERMPHFLEQDRVEIVGSRRAIVVEDFVAVEYNLTRTRAYKIKWVGNGQHIIGKGTCGNPDIAHMGIALERTEGA
jgi:hypothetical protein